MSIELVPANPHLTGNPGTTAVKFDMITNALANLADELEAQDASGNLVVTDKIRVVAFMANEFSKSSK